MRSSYFFMNLLWFRGNGLVFSGFQKCQEISEDFHGFYKILDGFQRISDGFQKISWISEDFRWFSDGFSSKIDQKSVINRRKWW